MPRLAPVTTATAGTAGRRWREGMGRRALLVATALLALSAAPSASAAVTAATAPTRTVHVGKLRLGYRSIGTGRPVVFIQGLGGSMDGWDPTFLDKLAAAGHR